MKTIFIPYRICPLGCHIDHQNGQVTGFAINKGIHLSYTKNNDDRIILRSLQFSKEVQFNISSVSETKENDWADYVRGIVIQLKKDYDLKFGITAFIDGDLKIGGLASSACICIGFALAIANVNRILLNVRQAILIAQRAENDYVKVSCGLLDQSCIIYCKKDSLLSLDIAKDEYKNISAKNNNFKIALFFSGIERQLIQTDFNQKVNECNQVVSILNNFYNQDKKYLRDYSAEKYLYYRNEIPLQSRLRADHFYKEMSGVESGIVEWKKGNLEQFGKIITECGKSSIQNYQTGSEQLQKLYNIINSIDGVYGGRFCGAGFNGYCFALIDPMYEENILQLVKENYLKEFPQLANKYDSCICETTDGIQEEYLGE